jgi:hypothetical protein
MFKVQSEVVETRRKGLSDQDIFIRLSPVKWRLVISANVDQRSSGDGLGKARRHAVPIEPLSLLRMCRCVVHRETIHDKRPEAACGRHIGTTVSPIDFCSIGADDTRI